MTSPAPQQVPSIGRCDSLMRGSFRGERTSHDEGVTLRWARSVRRAARGVRTGARQRLGCVPAEGGQILAITAILTVAIIAMGAFVLDVGAWFRTHRAAQATADAAALAGAQALPVDTATSTALALEYAAKNEGGTGAPEIRFETRTLPNDTIAVTARDTAPGFLAAVLGINSVDIEATAVARAYNLGEARYAGPFAVDRAHPLISGGGCPCFDEPTSLELGKIGPGAFKVVNIDGSRGGIGQQTLAEWILRGYDGYMPLGWYYSDPWAKFNPGAVQGAMEERIGEELLLPVYDAVQAQGANFEYRVVGWVGFLLTGYEARGDDAKLYGEFRSIVWEGIGMESAEGYLGARVIKLVG